MIALTAYRTQWKNERFSVLVKNTFRFPDPWLLYHHHRYNSSAPVPRQKLKEDDKPRKERTSYSDKEICRNVRGSRALIGQFLHTRSIVQSAAARCMNVARTYSNIVNKAAKSPSTRTVRQLSLLGHAHMPIFGDGSKTANAWNSALRWILFNFSTKRMHSHR